VFPWKCKSATKKTESVTHLTLNSSTMKKSFKFLSTGILIASLIILNSCSSSDGEVGPKGDTGASGETGAAGPKGDPGSANVIYSNWIPATFTGSGSSYSASITVPKLTQEMLDKADIRVYWTTENRVLTLPYAQVLSGTSYTVHQRFYVGKIELLASYAITSAQSFRYVIIPGGVTARKKPLSQMSYEEVKALYNIPD